jgi:hypothetical protein
LRHSATLLIKGKFLGFIWQQAQPAPDPESNIYS